MTGQPPHVLPANVPSRFDHVWRWSQAAAALLALAMLFRGRGRSLNWVVLFFALPALRLAASAAHRAEARAWLAGLWRDLGRYPAEAAVPWRAVFAFVVVPVLALLSVNNHCLRSGDSAPV